MTSLSLYDDNLDNNVVSLENFEEINEDYLLRAPKKGKLIKGPNWTAYKRENLGTIPRKIEKVLIQDQEGKTKIAFLSQTERVSHFGKLQSAKPTTPGPGSYQLTKDFNTTSSSISAKGLGNGFVSTAERFDEAKFYYDKYYPGPGQYKPDAKVSIKYDLDRNIQYQSLYDKSEIKSLKVRHDLPGPGYYNPILLTTTDSKGSLSVFKSNVLRFRRETKTANPGPGKYFLPKETEPDNSQDNKGNTLSYFFKQPLPKKDDPLLKFIEQPEDKMSKTHADLNYNYDKVFNFTKTSFRKTNEVKNMNSTKKELLSAINQKYKSKQESKPAVALRHHSAHPSLSLRKTPGTSDVIKLIPNSQHVQEANYIREVLGKTKKKPLFELSPPRWNEKLYQHIPGPAYYNPAMTGTKSNFYNENLQRWMN